MSIVGQHARQMTVALIWGLVVWLALFDFTLLFVMH
jgi:hypothetical protein